MTSLAPAAVRCAIIALVVLTGALALRLVGIGERSFWTDEGYSAWLSAQSVPVILDHDPFHPPLYPLLLKTWAGLGPWFDTDAGRRLPSALAGALTVLVCVGTVRVLRLPGAGLAALLTSSSAIGVWYSQEQRSVALTALLLAVAAGSLAVLAGRMTAPISDGLLWIGYILAASLGVWTHYGMIPLLVVLNLAFAVVARPTGRRLAVWVASNALVLAAGLPLAGRLSVALGQFAGHRFAERALLLFLPGVGILAVVAAGGWWLARRRPDLARPAAGLGGALVVVGLAAIMLTPAGNSVKRHLALVAPLVLTASAVAIAAWLPRVGWLVTIAGLPALVLVLFVHPKEDWRGVAATLSNEGRPGDAIVLYQGYEDILLRRYYQGDLPLVGFPEGGDPANAATATEMAQRVWLVEVNPTTPASLVPALSAVRRVTLDRQFAQIRVVRFD